MAEPELGTQLGAYHLEAVAGRGGMGVVYRATQTQLKRTVALKLIAEEMASDLIFRERFVRESLRTASIDHPNVIPVYDAGELDGALFIAMRYVDGTDLGEIIDANPEGLEPPRALRLVTQIAAALDAAHRLGLVHRDIKPANALVTREDDEHVYLTDFGLTTQATGGTQLTRPGTFVGTLAYISPEQLQGDPASTASDIYSLACLLWHALTGTAPFERGTEMATMYAQVYDPAPRLSETRPGLPAALDDVLVRALAKEPEERYASAGEFARAATRAAAMAAGPGSVAPGPGAAAVAAADSPAPSQHRAQSVPSADAAAAPERTAKLADAADAPAAAATATPAPTTPAPTPTATGLPAVARESEGYSAGDLRALGVVLPALLAVFLVIAVLAVGGVI